MVASLLIMFREALEAVLVTGIVLAWLGKSSGARHRPKVWLGVCLGIAASILGAVLFQSLAGGFEGRSEQLFEAATMIAGAVLMTTAVVWMTRHGSAPRDLDRAGGAAGWGFFFLVFVSILREGIEAVLFLSAARFASPDNDLLGAGLGLAAALVAGWLLLRAAGRARLGTFFLVVNSLLVLFAAGLLAQGLHELTEAGVVPPIVAAVWDINPAVRPDGTFPLMHDQGFVGGTLRGLFGYRGAPTLVELLGWVAYLGLSVVVWASARRKKRAASAPAH
jgi:high-affinity iron transporter